MHASHVDHGGLFQNNLLELLLIYEMGPWSPTRVGVKKNMQTHHQYICSFFLILELYLSYILRTVCRRNLKGYINCQIVKRKIDNNASYFKFIQTGCSVNSKVPENYSSKNNNNTHIYNKPSVSSSLMFRPLRSQLRGKKFKPKILLGEKM